jgi:hypothetical protein
MRWRDVLPAKVAAAQDAWEWRHRIRTAHDVGASFVDIASHLGIRRETAWRLYKQARGEIRRGLRSPAENYINPLGPPLTAYEVRLRLRHIKWRSRPPSGIWGGWLKRREEVQLAKYQLRGEFTAEGKELVRQARIWFGEKP